jgi:hypothetical protein
MTGWQRIAMIFLFIAGALGAYALKATHLASSLGGVAGTLAVTHAGSAARARFSPVPPSPNGS